MKQLIKPKSLQSGDKVATISLSWGGAGDADFLWRYLQGKSRLEAMGFEVVELKHTLSGSDYLYQHPEARAEDLMTAFRDPEIKGIFSCIGGDDSIRLLPYVDLNVIRNNPKVFIGYSDTTVTHLLCYKAGLSSFYGPSVLMEFAENVTMHDYTLNGLKKCLMCTEPLGQIPAPSQWTGEYLPWLIENKDKQRILQARTGYECIQGRSVVEGHLIGGCVEVLEMAKGTSIWPNEEDWQDSIIFLETSEDMIAPAQLGYILRNYVAQGILNRAKGLMFGKPYQDQYYEAYKAEILKVLREANLEDLPVFYNMAFGHTSPMMTLPYGAKARLDCENRHFTILESGVNET